MLEYGEQFVLCQTGEDFGEVDDERDSAAGTVCWGVLGALALRDSLTGREQSLAPPPPCASGWVCGPGGGEREEGVGLSGGQGVKGRGG